MNNFVRKLSLGPSFVISIICLMLHRLRSGKSRRTVADCNVNSLSVSVGQ